MIPLSEKEIKDIEDQVKGGNNLILVKGMYLRLNSFIAMGTFIHPDKRLIESLVHGSNEPTLVTEPLGRPVATSNIKRGSIRRYWWDYENDKPMYDYTAKKSLISAYKRLGTKYALFVNPPLIKKEDASHTVDTESNPEGTNIEL